MTTEDKFNAAVNVIRSLPKNGSYQPSNELMLRFYSYFKQATQGPCCGSRPPFWDVVGRAKYDAWKKLGDMSKNDAMTKYVDELHSIVETMSYSDKVANFLEAPTNELDGINMDDLELVAGDVIEKVRSQPNSPLMSREGSPVRFISNISSSRSSLASEDHSDDEYRDTIDLPNQLLENAEEKLRHMQEINIPNGDIGKPGPHNQRTIDISKEIAKTIDSLRGDIQRLTNQVNLLELAKQNTSTRPKNLFQGIGKEMAIFMIVWPFIASFIVSKWVLRNK